MQESSNPNQSNEPIQISELEIELIKFMLEIFKRDNLRDRFYRLLLAKRNIVVTYADLAKTLWNTDELSDTQKANLRNDVVTINKIVRYRTAGHIQNVVKSFPVKGFVMRTR